MAAGLGAATGFGAADVGTWAEAAIAATLAAINIAATPCLRRI
jgi:hypothetical protein